jgi:hypothetical protein
MNIMDNDSKIEYLTDMADKDLFNKTELYFDREDIFFDTVEDAYEFILDDENIRAIFEIDLDR